MILLEMPPDTSHLMLLLNAVCFILIDDFRYYQGLEWISKARQRMDDLQRLLELTEQITVNPAILIDNNRRVLAVSPTQPNNDQELLRGIRERQLSAACLEHIHSENVYEPLHSDYLKNSHLAWTFRNYLCIPIRFQGLQVAELIIRSVRIAFYHSVIRLMTPLAELIAECVAQQMQFQDDRALLHSLLFNELLRANPSQESTLRRQIQKMGWQETENMLCAICGPTDDHGNLDARYAAIRAAVPDCRWQLNAGKLSLLLYPMEAETWDALSAALEQQQLAMGCSWPTDNLMQLRYAHLQAAEALTQGMAERPDQRIHHYSTYFSSHVLQLPPAEVPYYLHPAIRTLALYDQGHEGNLLETLERYLAGPDQPNEIAASLFIHRSTLFYRLNRIRELAPQIDWATGEERMNLLLSMRLLKRL